jgi:hypothetical protein
MRALRIGGALAAAALALCLVVGAQPPLASAAAGDPLFIMRPEPPKPFNPPIPPPTGVFEGPCGLAVDGNGRFYVADYFHHTVDVYSPGTAYLTQLAGEDPLDGPCGLAIGPAGNLYVNNFHRNVIRFGDSSSFGAGTVLAGAGVDPTHPTGVAVDSSGTVYVNERDRVATFDSAGTEGEPIGVGSLADGYGVAVSGYPATAGYAYVPDAATSTVKVYDPATSRTTPVAALDGSGTPLGHFVSLRDAAVAVDDVSGTVYVVDDLTPAYTEGHEGVVYAFDSTGTYLGRLKYGIETALPAGLAVDNSSLPSQGRVYVTSGYTELAAVYAYAPGSAGAAAVSLPGASPTGSPAAPASSPASPEPTALVATATVVQETIDPGRRLQVKKNRKHRRHRHQRAAGGRRR